MKNRKVLTEPEVRYYMVQICEGVRYLHRKTILHRDLKLGNMFLTWDMTVKIGDFGLATQHQASISSVSTLCGTPNYIAPEVLKKQVCSLYGNTVYGVLVRECKINEKETIGNCIFISSKCISWGSK